MSAENVLLEVKDLKKYFPIQKGFLRRVAGHVKAVDGVSFSINRGETLGLVGESGCGKTTLGRCLLRAVEPTEGHVYFRPVPGEPVDIPSLDPKSLRSLRRHAQMIFQDPYSSLDPRMTVLEIVGEPLVCAGMANGRALEDRVKGLMEVVGLDVRHLNRYPHAFSGGQRQRIGVARALSTNPALIIADEAVSALDVSVQAQVLNLLQDLQKEFHLTYLFISHDLGVIEHVSDRVAVMYVGKIVEMSEAEELFLRPRHPYTEALLQAIPKPDPERRASAFALPGEVPNPANPPAGCYFHPRCTYAQPRCSAEAPDLRDIGIGHSVACHFADSLSLQGVE